VEIARLKTTKSQCTNSHFIVREFLTKKQHLVLIA